MYVILKTISLTIIVPTLINVKTLDFASFRISNVTCQFVNIIGLEFAMAEKLVQRTVLFVNLLTLNFVKSFVNTVMITN